MLKLNASYSKKVPTNEKFSSQSFLASNPQTEILADVGL